MTIDTWILVSTSITSVIAIVIAILALLQTKSLQKDAFLLDLIKEESRLACQIRASSETTRELYTETYLNFFDGLALWWKKRINKKDAEDYFKNMVIGAAESEGMKNYIAKKREKNIDAFNNFEWLYKEMGGKQWLKKEKE